MLLSLAPWGPPVPTLYLLMNTICRLPSSAGTDAIFSISMTNPSSHLSHFVSEEKEGQAEMGKPALGASCKHLPSAPSLQHPSSVSPPGLRCYKQNREFNRLCPNLAAVARGAWLHSQTVLAKGQRSETGEGSGDDGDAHTNV